MSKLPDDVVGYECKHAFYSQSIDGSKDDLVLVKRNVHKKDGTYEPEVTFVENYQRDFWVVNPMHRTYNEKKAWEDEFKCKKFTCRQTELQERVARALGRSSFHGGMSIMFRDQYVYGADITTTALIKRAYMDKFSDLVSESTVGVMDIETDVVDGDGSEIISASFTYRDKIYIAYTDKFVGKHAEIEDKIQEKYRYYMEGIVETVKDKIAEMEAYRKELPGIVSELDAQLKEANANLVSYISKQTTLVHENDLDDDERYLELEEAIESIERDKRSKLHHGVHCKSRIPVLKQALGELETRVPNIINAKKVATPGQVVQFVFEAAHEHKPDFVAFWNMNFDLPKMIAALEADGTSLKHVFCDPSVPERFKYFKYKPGQAIKQIAGNRTMSKHPAELWHVVNTMASFYLIDAMCVFKQVRVTEGNRNSYSLDAILGDELDLGKLKFSEADHLHGLEWHEYMQTNHKIEYLIYNIFDCLLIEIMDVKNKDLALTVPTLCQHSDYGRFPSTPRRLCDDLHFYLRERGKVISTTSDDMTEDLDEHVVGSKNWIVTLASHLVADNGLCLIKEAPHLRSMVRAFVADLDVASSYPNTGIFMNMGMETTKMELVGVGGVDENSKRMAGINLTAARTNAAECAKTFFGFPTKSALLAAYREKKLNEDFDNKVA